MVGIATKNLSSSDALGKVDYLPALDKLRNTHALVISNRYLSSTANEASRLTGIKFSLMSGNEFVEKSYKKVDERDARPISESWIKSAAAFPIPEKQNVEVLKSARLYLSHEKSFRGLRPKCDNYRLPRAQKRFFYRS